jgi:hypothetical protein
MATMGYDLAARRQLKIDRLNDKVEGLEEALNERDALIMELRDELAAKDRRIDALEAFPIARRDG